MKKIYLTLCLSLVTFLAFAQIEADIFTVRLNDGSYLKGQLLSTTNADPLIVKTLTGDEIKVAQSSIRRIDLIDQKQRILDNGKTLNHYGTYSTLLLGLLSARDDTFDEEIILGLTVVNYTIGHQFNQYLALGGGFSWDVYDMSIFSLHADFRGFYNEKKISPYYSFQAGYGLPGDLNRNWDDRIELKGGPSIHPAIGLRFATHNKANFLLELGYRFQWAERNDPELQRYDKILYRRLALRLGWKF